MIWWSREFKEKLNVLKIRNDVLQIYVDDVNGVFPEIKPGTVFKNEKLEHDEKKRARRPET